jgi:hypothetical protein
MVQCDDSKNYKANMKCNENAVYENVVNDNMLPEPDYDHLG